VILRDIVSPIGSVAIANHPLIYRPFRGNCSVDNYTKPASFFVLCTYDGRLYSSADNVELDITPPWKSAFTAINVAGNNKIYTRNHKTHAQVMFIPVGSIFFHSRTHNNEFGVKNLTTKSRYHVLKWLTIKILTNCINAEEKLRLQRNTVLFLSKIYRLRHSTDTW